MEGCYEGKVFAVRVSNNGDETVTIKYENVGCVTDSNSRWEIGIDAFDEYKSGSEPGELSPLAPGEKDWLLVKTVNPNNFIEVLANYTVECSSTPDLTVEIFMANKKEAIPEITKPLPVLHNKYCVGYGNKYYILAKKEYKVSKMIISNGETSVYHSVSCAPISENLGEGIELTLSQDPTETLSEFKNDEFGPYAVHYNFQKAFINDSMKKVKIVGYLIGGAGSDRPPSDTTSHCASISSGNDSKGVFLGIWGVEGYGKYNNRWKFYESPELNPNDVDFIQYQYILLSKGGKHGVIQYEVVAI